MITRHKHQRSISHLCLGTVQLGQPYGIANRSGMPSFDDAKALLLEAWAKGVTLFDTAQAYGESEMRVGAALAATPATVMTKLSPLADLAVDAEPSAVTFAVTRSIEASQRALRQEQLAYVLVHRAAHLTSHGGAVWQALLALQARGAIQWLGASVSTPQEAQQALALPQVACLQLPYNLLDRRWDVLADLLARRRDVLVLARSALLQGVIAQPPNVWPVVSLDQSHAICATLDRFAASFGLPGRAALALAFVRGQSWIDSIIVGMETMEQLTMNLALFDTPALTAAQCAAVRAELPELSDAFVNPANWPKGASAHA